MLRLNRRDFLESGLAAAAAAVAPFTARAAQSGRPGPKGKGFIAGFGKADITPSRPEPTNYSEPKVGPIGAIMDHVHVRTTYLGKGDEQAVLVSCDLLGLPTWFTDAVKSDLAKLGIPPDRVAITCSHDHTAPQILFFRGIGQTDDTYNEFAKERIVQSVRDAMADAEPAAIGFGAIDAPLNVNRVQIGRLLKVNSLDTPSGRVDQQLCVIRIYQSKSRKAGLIYNFAAHPLTVWTNHLVISSDYPGYASAILEAEPDIKLAQFAQGCAGNMNTRINGDQAVTSQFARLLTDYVKKACAGIAMRSNPNLGMKTQEVHLPHAKLPTLQEVDSILAAQEKKPPSSDTRVAEWARSAKQALAEGRNLKTADAIFQGIRLGDARVAVLPGEVFAEIGLAIKRQVGGNVAVLAYSNNGEVGYVPTAEQLRLGGYEAQDAPRWYGLFPWSQDIEQYYVSHAVSLLQSL
ncbi:MAG TPA: neutral/alkaline non-lysosomal ceramidase N-terminal domain-containing protein [Bryobacteraceae bacterium]|nr:neutral/alkaline non-lysosomal ceramidase N-terminal domain-containing protein [Bryobacteraceae bacterium]